MINSYMASELSISNNNNENGTLLLQEWPNKLAHMHKHCHKIKNTLPAVCILISTVFFLQVRLIVSQ